MRARHMMRLSKTNREAAIRWIHENAHPLTTVDPRAPLIDLELLFKVVGGVKVVGHSVCNGYSV